MFGHMKAQPILALAPASTVPPQFEMENTFFR